MEIKLCPTCKRRPSERDGSDRHPSDAGYEVTSCVDEIHDVADAGPAILEALLYMRRTLGKLPKETIGPTINRIDATIALARAEVSDV